MQNVIAKYMKQLSVITVLFSIVIGTSTSLFSQNAHAQTVIGIPSDGNCGLPFCNIQAKTQEFRQMWQNVRYQNLISYNQHVSEITDIKSLKNVQAMAVSIKNLFIEVKEEEWMIREVDRLIFACLYQMLTSPASTVDELISYFGQVNSDGVRFEVLKFQRDRIANIKTKEELIDFDRFFLAAIDMTKSNEHWVGEVAYWGVDMISYRMFTEFPLTIAEQKKYFALISGDQLRFDMMSSYPKQAEDNKTNAKWLKESIELLQFAVKDSAKNAGWVQNAASSALAAVSSTFIRLNTVSLDEMELYLANIRFDQTRFDLFQKLMRAADLNAQDDAYLIKLSQFFEFAMNDSKNGFEKWVSNAASDGLQSVNTRLIKRPAVNSTEMVKYFKTISSDHSRNDILNYWRAREKYYFDTASILELVRFFYEAKVDCVDKGNEEWVIISARGGEVELTERLAELHPVYEGAYALTTRCSDGTQSCGAKAIDRMVIYNTNSSEGWSVGFSNSRTQTMAFTFPNAEITKAATYFSSLYTVSGALSKLVVKYNHGKGTVSGFIESSDFDGRIEFTGKQVSSPLSVYDIAVKKAPIDVEELQGTFTGAIDGKLAKLIVSQVENGRGPKILNGLLSVNGLNLSRISLDAGKFASTNNTLILFGAQDSGEKFKIVSYVEKKSEGHFVLNAVYFDSTSGRMTPLVLEN